MEEKTFVFLKSLINTLDICILSSKLPLQILCLSTQMQRPIFYLIFGFKNWLFLRYKYKSD
jgi:hypothetical protein